MAVRTRHIVALDVDVSLQGGRDRRPGGRDAPQVEAFAGRRRFRRGAAGRAAGSGPSVGPGRGARPGAPAWWAGAAEPSPGPRARGAAAPGPRRRPGSAKPGDAPRRHGRGAGTRWPMTACSSVCGAREAVERDPGRGRRRTDERPRLRGCSCRRDSCRRRAGPPRWPPACPSGTARTAARDTARRTRAAPRRCRSRDRSRSRRPGRCPASGARFVRNCDIPALITGQIVVHVVKMKLTRTGLSDPIASRSVVARPFWSTSEMPSMAGCRRQDAHGRRLRRRRHLGHVRLRGRSAPARARGVRRSRSRTPPTSRPSSGSSLLLRGQGAESSVTGMPVTLNSPIVTVTVLPTLT